LIEDWIHRRKGKIDMFQSWNEEWKDRDRKKKRRYSLKRMMNGEGLNKKKNENNKRIFGYALK
jgi:hypothetical protein